jgi:DNA helicase-2/ATP-dependent DNA helicase PcrA
VGAAPARRVMTELGVGAPASEAPAATTPLARLLAAAPTVPEAARAEMSGLRTALGECVEPGVPAGVQVDRLRGWLEPVVHRRSSSPAARCGDLAALAEQAAQARSRSRFVADVTIDPPVRSGDMAGRPSLDDDWLVLSTVHSAKGGEWTVVHVIHAADGSFPSDLSTGDAGALAEERRLFYVAVTRARDVLEIDVPMRFHWHRHRLDDLHDYASLSRFLSPAVQALMDTTHAGIPTGGGRIGAAPAPTAENGVALVDSLLADLWS